MEQPINIPISSDAASEMVVATRPNEIELSKNDTPFFKTHIEKRTFLTDRIEYLVQVSSQMMKIQTPHRIKFDRNVKFM